MLTEELPGWIEWTGQKNRLSLLRPVQLVDLESCSPGPRLTEAVLQVSGPHLWVAQLDRLDFSDDQFTRFLQHSPDLTILSFSGERLTDVGLAALPNCPDLRQVGILEASAITGEGLKHLTGLKQLERLHLENATLADRGLAAISRCRSTTELSCSNVTFTGTLPAGRTGLRKLSGLVLHECRISSECLAQFGRCPLLRQVYLSGTPIDSQGLSSLGRLPLLTHFTLNSADIDDSDLRGLADWPTLKYLDLSSLAIADGAVAWISQCRSLQHLHVEGTGMSESAVGQLRQKLPACEIYVGATAPALRVISID